MPLPGGITQCSCGRIAIDRFLYRIGANFAREYLARGIINSPSWYLIALVTGKANGIFYFVPLLCLLYLLSPVLVYFGKIHYKFLLIVAIFIQLGAVLLDSLHYLEYLNIVKWKIPALDQLWIYVPSLSPVWHIFYFVL